MADETTLTLTPTATPDYVPAGGPPEPKPSAPPVCEICRHAITGRQHVNIAGYGDPAKHCRHCEACDRLRALWRAGRRAERRAKGMT